MLSRAASRIVYVQPTGAASFSLSSLSRSGSSLSPSLSSSLRVPSRRFATTTAATPPPPPPLASTPTAASSTAAAAAQTTSGAGGSGSSGAGKESFFKSDSWTKTVGTIGALANWSIPLAAISHIMSTKDPATTIDPVMTTCQRRATRTYQPTQLLCCQPSTLTAWLVSCGMLCAFSALAVYSLLFMRWAIAITPANYPLLVCHIANEAAQLTQLGRYAMASVCIHTLVYCVNGPLDSSTTNFVTMFVLFRSDVQ